MSDSPRSLTGSPVMVESQPTDTKDQYYYSSTSPTDSKESDHSIKRGKLGKGVDDGVMSVSGQLTAYDPTRDDSGDYERDGALINDAQHHDRALAALSALLSVVDQIQGWTTHEQQAAIREARCVLAERRP